MAKIKITTMLKEANINWLRSHAGGDRQIGGLIDDCIDIARHGKPIAERIEDALAKLENILIWFEAMMRGQNADQQHGLKRDTSHVSLTDPPEAKDEMVIHNDEKPSPERGSEPHHR